MGSTGLYGVRLMNSFDRTPLWGADHLLFVSSAYNGGSRVLKLSRTGDRVSAEEVWANKRVRIHFGNAVRFEHRIYASSGDFGSAPFAAIDVSTGEMSWRDRSMTRSTLNSCGHSPDHSRRRRQPGARNAGRERAHDPRESPDPARARMDGSHPLRNDPVRAGSPSGHGARSGLPPLTARGESLAAFGPAQLLQSHAP